MGRIFGHNSAEYLAKWSTSGKNRWNGAYYYSIEIEDNMIPNISTDRNWVLLNVEGCCWDHSIVFIHNNVNTATYNWLASYEDLVLVCGVPQTVEKVEHLGKAVYLPISVDVPYVEQFVTCGKDRDTAYVGRPSKKRYGSVDPWVDHIGGMQRPQLLQLMARYRKIYAVGRTAIEGRILGCDILPFDERYPDPSIWRIFDNRDAAVELQKILDEIDGRPA